MRSTYLDLALRLRGSFGAMMQRTFSPVRDSPERWAEVLALHAMFLLTGVGTVVLGPLLPALSLRWSIGDQGAGMLLAAQFLGSFLGGVTLRNELRTELAAGCAACVLGYACIAASAGSSAGYAFGVFGFLLAGFGLGRVITSINLIAGAKFVERRASAFALLNLTWGVGALVCPLAAENMVIRFGLAEFYAMLAALNAAVMLCGLMMLRQSVIRTPEEARSVREGRDVNSGWIRYALAFMTYGGIEASLSGWTSSLTLRSTAGTLPLAAGVTTTLWVGMTVGRGAAAALFLRVRERVVLVGAVLLSGVLTLVLLEVRMSGVALLAFALGLGVALAPAFPALCSLLMAEDFCTGNNGRAMAATALGSAIVPWMVGVVSERTGALQHGLLLPAGLCGVLAVFVRTLAPARFARQKD